VKVTEDSFVTIDYLIRLPGGQTFPADGIPDTISFCMGHGVMPPALEAAMLGMTVNEHKQVQLLPSEAYGEVDEELITEVNRADFDPETDLRPGLIFETLDDENQPVHFVVVEVKPDTVVIDFNHPLAGKEVEIAFTIRGVREAKPEDLHRCVHCEGDESPRH
jgi:FKBP-type peptidyl-prolyl cis-trans isomerase 2